MKTGISLYPGLDNSLEENLELLEKAVALGIDQVFTSLHIPETDTVSLQRDVSALFHRARKLGCNIISDVSPETCELLQIDELTPSALKELGISTVRFDFGCPPARIAHFSKEMDVQLNASTLTPELAADLVQAGADFTHIESLHNFYPRPHTGLAEDYFTKQTRWQQRAGIRVGAFIPSQAGRRSPLREGLPTLEDHRSMPVDLSGRHLASLGVDAVFIGDSRPSANELQSLSHLAQNTVTIQARQLNPDSIASFLLSHTLTARPDPARDAIRAQESRSLLKNYFISPDYTASMDKVPGDVTLDNETYGRYMGELQIVTTAITADGRTNTIARILPEERFLLKYIQPGRKFKIELLEQKSD